MASISGGTNIEFMPTHGFCLVIAPKRDKVHLFNIKERNEVNYIKVKDSEITSHCVNSLGTMFALGFSDGMVRTYHTKTMQMMNEYDYFRREGGEYLATNLDFLGHFWREKF